MPDTNDAFCPNVHCKDYGLQNHGNIALRGTYGKGDKKVLLYCLTCGKRFASTRKTAFFGFHISDKQIEQIIKHTANGTGVRETARRLNMNIAKHN